MNEFIYGIHTIESLLKHDSSCFLHVYIVNSFLNKRLQFLIQELKRLDIPVQYCNRRFLDNIVRCMVHQGIVAKIYKKNIFTERDISNLLQEYKKTSCLLLVLDNIMDPRNLGACLRSAGAFGVNIVIVPRRRSVGLSGVVRKVASGMADKISFVRVTNLVRTLRFLKECGVWIVGTVLQSECSIFQAKFFNSRLALVMGSEGSGIRFLTRRYCDELVSIPMDDVSVSLNVSVATGICLFEVLKQRLCCSI